MIHGITKRKKRAFFSLGRHMDLRIDRADISDIDGLLGLYLSIYGDDYPLEIGTNKSVMTHALNNPDKFLWYVMRDDSRGVIAGSCIVEIDTYFKIGKVTGVTTSRDYRGKGVAKKLIAHGTREIVDEKKMVNSLYATSRTISPASQVMLLHNNYLPLGIFPNARKIKTYESLALLGYFGEGVLERRIPVEKIPSHLGPITDIVCETVGMAKVAQKMESCPINSYRQINEDQSLDGGFEFMYAPKFVDRRFEECFNDDKESMFYPFHRPNLLIASESGDMEIFASFNKKDHYCVLITATNSIRDLRDRFNKLLFQMKDHGIYYVETLVRMDYFDTICFMAENKFLPSAIYPAMREIDGEMHDYVLLTRTMVPLDFSEMKIDDSFRPYVNQYARQWVHHNLATIEDQL